MRLFFTLGLQSTTATLQEEGKDITGKENYVKNLGRRKKCLGLTPDKRMASPVDL